MSSLGRIIQADLALEEKVAAQQAGHLRDEATVSATVEKHLAQALAAHVKELIAIHPLIVYDRSSALERLEKQIEVAKEIATQLKTWRA